MTATEGNAETSTLAMPPQDFAAVISLNRGNDGKTTSKSGLALNGIPFTLLY